MKFLVTAMFVAALATQPGSAFTTSSTQANAVRNTDTSLFLEPSALTEYMAKAHEEKLKAVKAAEQKKDSEIQALKKQVEELKSAPPASGALVAPTAPTLDVGDMSKEQMATKLLSYQQFMAKYIVEAQQEKIRAVQAAELAMKNKYEEKLRLLQAGAPSEPAPAPAAITPEKSLYEERNAKVAAAAEAGKSRWGDMENAKAAGAAPSISAPPPTPVAAQAEQINGLTEVNGATMTPDQTLFDKRNSMVAASAKAGKSRWGDMEVAKATKLSASLPAAPAATKTPAVTPVPEAPKAPKVPVPPEVAAADHGLRNDGGVGGPSLAERINLGAQLLGATAAPAPVAPVVVASSTAAEPSLYDKRNARVAAAAKAGKSRWGAMEIKKTQELATALPSASVAAAPVVPVPPEVEAADHGLRNDGGVGGPSLAQRVNLGAAILGQ